MTLVVDELPVSSDLRLDQATQFAEVTLIDGALVAVGDDVVVYGLEGGVHRGYELATGWAGAGVLDGPTAVVSGVRTGGFWHGAKRVAFYSARMSPGSEQGGQVFYDCTRFKGQQQTGVSRILESSERMAHLIYVPG